MTNEEKSQITILRCAGYSYGEIAKMLNISRSAIANYCWREQLAKPEYKNKEYKVCLNCRRLFFPSGKQKYNRCFCSAKCRNAYWRKRRNESLAMKEEANEHQTIHAELDQLEPIQLNTHDSEVALCYRRETNIRRKYNDRE